jgi:hypothetical protein
MTKLQEEMIKADEDLANGGNPTTGPVLDLTAPVSNRRA